MNRHTINLLLVAALIVTLGLSACSGGNDEQETVLNVYNWSTYIAPELIPAFESKYGVTVNYVEYASNDELYNTIKAGNTYYDIIVPTDYMAEQMINEGLVVPLSRTMIKNFGNIDTLFIDPPYDPGNQYCVPYQWGTVGLGYNNVAVQQSVDSWEVMFNGEHSGRISWLDERRLTLGVTLIYLGYDPNTIDPAQINEAAQLLLDTQADVAAFAPDTGQELLNDRSVDIAMEWSGDIFQLMAGNHDIEYVIPKEGTLIWTDNMCIPVGAPHPNLAHKFIDFILDKDIGAILSNYTQYGTPNNASKPMIDQILLLNPGIYPPEDVMERMHFIESVGDADQLYVDAWAKLGLSE